MDDKSGGLTLKVAVMTQQSSVLWTFRSWKHQVRPQPAMSLSENQLWVPGAARKLNKQLLSHNFYLHSNSGLQACVQKLACKIWCLYWMFRCWLTTFQTTFSQKQCIANIWLRYEYRVFSNTWPLGRQLHHAPLLCPFLDYLGAQWDGNSRSHHVEIMSMFNIDLK